MLDRETLVSQFFARTLPLKNWTHEAHLIVCQHVLTDATPSDALDILRSAIRSYNEAVGTPNADDSGYHETLTRYYIGAVAAAARGRLDAIPFDPRTDRAAPLQHWTRAVLFSPTARHDWAEPDLRPLWIDFPRFV